MLKRLTLFPVLALAFIALLVGGLFSVREAEAVPFGYGGTVVVDAPFYSSGAVFWSFRMTNNHTVAFPATVAISGWQTGTGYAAPLFGAVVPGVCTLGNTPVTCNFAISGQSGSVITLILFQSIEQTCAARDFIRPAVTITGWPGSLGGAEPPIDALPALNVPGLVPANPALCPIPATPIPNTPVPATATPTLVPVAVVPVIPQVFQHPVGGIFNGSRNNTPTPVRPAAAVVAPSGPATMPVLRPPSTGDAGLLLED